MFFSSHNRSRAAGKSLHIGFGWPAWRGCVQLWRIGKCLQRTALWIYLSHCFETVNINCLFGTGRSFVCCNSIICVLKLMHPVLESLRKTDKQWLIDTLYAFNAGNVERFQALKTAWGQQVTKTFLLNVQKCQVVFHCKCF